MKVSKIHKKKSSQSVTPTATETEPNSSKIWGRHSLIFSQSKAQFMHGLLALVQKKAISLSESFEEDQRAKEAVTNENDIKNDVKNNPFLMVKAKLLKQKESLQTQNTSLKDKFYFDPPMEDTLQLADKKTITFKQLLKLERKKQKVVLRPFTDRI